MLIVFDAEDGSMIRFESADSDSPWERVELPGAERPTEVYGCAVLPDGQLLVSDRANDRVMVIDLDGNFIATVTVSPELGPMLRPTGVAVAVDATVCVVDSGTRRLLSGPVGGALKLSYAPVGAAQFVAPHGVVATPHAVIVTDPGAGQVIVLGNAAGDGREVIRHRVPGTCPVGLTVFGEEALVTDSRSRQVCNLDGLRMSKIVQLQPDACPSAVAIIPNDELLVSEARLRRYSLVEVGQVLGADRRHRRRLRSAFAAEARRGDGDGGDPMTSTRLLAWNLQLFSWAAMMWKQGNPAPVNEAVARSTEIARRLVTDPEEWDIVGLCEVWHEGAHDILDEQTIARYPHRVAKADDTTVRIGVSGGTSTAYWTPLLNTAVTGRAQVTDKWTPEDSGVMLLSRLPFEMLSTAPLRAAFEPLMPMLGLPFPASVPAVAFFPYDDSDDDDSKSRKGLLYARLLREQKRIHVFVTHTQADYKSLHQYEGVRANQFAFAEQCIRACAGEPPFGEEVFFMGDFNVPGDQLNSAGDVEWRRLFATPGRLLTDSLLETWGGGQCSRAHRAPRPRQSVRRTHRPARSGPDGDVLVTAASGATPRLPPHVAHECACGSACPYAMGPVASTWRHAITQ